MQIWSCHPLVPNVFNSCIFPWFWKKQSKVVYSPTWHIHCLTLYTHVCIIVPATARHTEIFLVPQTLHATSYPRASVYAVTLYSLQLPSQLNSIYTVVCWFSSHPLSHWTSYINLFIRLKTHETIRSKMALWPCAPNLAVFHQEKLINEYFYNE